MDVLTVDRGDERLVEALDDVVGDPVAVLLADQDVAGQVVALGEVQQHLLEQARGAQDVAAGLLEQVEELAVARGETLGQPHRGQADRSIWSLNVEAGLFDARRGQLAHALADGLRAGAPVVLHAAQLDRAVVVHERVGGAVVAVPGHADAARVDQLDAARARALELAGGCARTPRAAPPRPISSSASGPPAARA